MKRYLVFGYNDCEPNGGMCDFIGMFEELEESIEYCDNFCKGGGLKSGHVFDCESTSIVYTGSSFGGEKFQLTY